MGRKKIKISQITDERNRQVNYFVIYKIVEKFCGNDEHWKLSESNYRLHV